MTAKVYWINKCGKLMSMEGNNMPEDVTGIVRSEIMSIDDAKKRYPEYFQQQEATNGENPFA